jgi:hypothetical protein
MGRKSYFVHHIRQDVAILCLKYNTNSDKACFGPAPGEKDNHKRTRSHRGMPLMISTREYIPVDIAGIAMRVLGSTTTCILVAIYRSFFMLYYTSYTVAIVYRSYTGTRVAYIPVHCTGPSIYSYTEMSLGTQACMHACMAQKAPGARAHLGRKCRSAGFLPVN